MKVCVNMNIRRFYNPTQKIKLNNSRGRDITMDNTMVIRPCTPAKSLKQSLKEMQLMREGKMEKRSYMDEMKDFYKDEDDEQGCD